MNKYKHTYIFCAFLSVWFGFGLTANAQYVRPTHQRSIPSSQNQVRIKNRPIRLQQDSVMIDMDIQIQGLSIDDKRQLVLTPILSTQGYNKALPQIIINGRKRHSLYKRALKLNKNDYRYQPYRVIKARNNDFVENVNYRMSIPVEPWMKKASLSLEQDLRGCADEVQRISVDMIEQQILIVNEPILNFDYSNAVISFIQPPREQIKNLAESDQAYVVFNVGKSDIVLSLDNNTEELRKITNSFDFIIEEPTAQIKSIVITAYASPEGSQANNKTLSERRASSLLSWIRSTKNLRGISRVSSVGRGEDWETLASLIQEDRSLSSDEKSAISGIINTTSNLDEREARIRAYKNGEPYRYIFNNLYPQLRRSDYLIEFTVPEFTLEKSLEMLKTKPGMLSQAEFYAIANTYEQGSKEFNQVFDVAVRLFPNDPVAILNAAAAELDANELNRAEQRLLPLKDDARAWNNLGVLYMKQLKVNEAEEYLRKAAGNGNRDAERNLRLIPLLKEEIEKYNKALEEYRFLN